MANGAGFRVQSLVVQGFKSLPLHHFNYPDFHLFFSIQWRNCLLASIAFERPLPWLVRKAAPQDIDAMLFHSSEMRICKGR